jgi:hypothetical protein
MPPTHELDQYGFLIPSCRKWPFRHTLSPAREPPPCILYSLAWPRPVWDGSAYPDDLADDTGLARSTVKNEINKLKKTGRVETTGEVRGQMEEVRLADSRTRPIKEKSTKSTPDKITVAGLFADPPDWLAKHGWPSSSRSTGRIPHGT